jgi:sugar/nucleoside kinase (ribokinase family)
VVGDDLFGEWMRARLGDRGVALDGVIVDPSEPTGLTVVLSRPDDRAILTHPGTIAGLHAGLVDPALLREARHVHVSSFYLQQRLTPDLPRLFREARERGTTTSLDPNWDPSGAWDGGLAEVLAHTDVFLPNAAEAVRIAGTDDVEDAARRLARSAALVVVKRGSDGALAARDGNVTTASGIAVDPEDATGSGDAFDAGFLASWLTGDSLERSLAVANACGALSTRALGGIDGQPTMHEATSAIAG